MFGCSRPFIYGMGPVGIFHKLKGLIVFHQLIEQHFRIVVVDIVIPAAMYIQQVSLQFASIGNRRSFDVICLGFQWITHISFLVYIIIGFHIIQCRNSEPRFIYFRDAGTSGSGWPNHHRSSPIRRSGRYPQMASGIFQLLPGPGREYSADRFYGKWIFSRLLPWVLACPGCPVKYRYIHLWPGRPDIPGNGLRHESSFTVAEPGSV